MQAQAPQDIEQGLFPPAPPYPRRLVALTLDGEPMHWERVRARWTGKFIQFFTSKEMDAYKLRIKQEARVAIGAASPVNIPCALMVRVFLPIPPSWPRRKREAALQGTLRPVTKPDADNFLKIAADALSEIIYDDDKQVVDMQVGKYYSDRPRMEIEVTV